MSQTRKSALVIGLMAVFAVGVALAVDKRPDAPGSGSSSKELVAAASEAYEGRLQLRRVVPEAVALDEIYVWSKRWMTAEWDLSLQTGGGGKAVKAHRDRMADLEQKVIQGQQNGQNSNADVAAARYYRVEAELMHARVGD